MDSEVNAVSGRRGTREPLSAQQRAAFLGALIGWVFDYYEVFLMTMLAVPIAKDLELSTGQVSVIFSVQLLFLGVGGVAFGRLADRVGRRPVLLWTVVIFTGGTLARAFSPNYLVLLILTGVAALGIGGEYGVGQTLVAEVMPAHRRGWYSGLLYGGIYVGIALGAVVGGYLAPAVGWRWTFALSGLPVLVAVYIRARMPESPDWQRSRSTTPVGAASTRRLLLSRRYLPALLLCLMAGALQFFGYYGLATFLPTFLVKQGFTMGAASWWLFFAAIAGAAGCLLGSWGTDRFGRRATLSTLASMAALGGLVLGLAWQHLLTSGWILVPFLLFFVGSNGAAVFGALFSEMFPTEIRATAVSSALQIARGLSLFPPLLAGYLLPRFGYAPVIYLSAAEFLALAALAWAFSDSRVDRLSISRR